jgi:tRNA G18 (ribose-2'-O)-methylase SpoU
VSAGRPERDALDHPEQQGPTEWPQPGDEVGVGPHPLPWPEDPRYDPELLADGDRRNVVDRYRYWRREAIVADLDTHRFPFEVAIENLGHDYNIGTIVRTANAFGAARVHIVGRRRWNRRGAMVTDRYQHLAHHEDAAALAVVTRAAGLVLVAVDNVPGARPLETEPLPLRCVLMFGTEGAGLSAVARAVADRSVTIAQFGSTRSINVGVAAGIAMHSWIRQHAEVSTVSPKPSGRPGSPR